MEDKLKSIESEYNDISSKLSLPETISDNRLFASLSKKFSELSGIVDKYHRYTAVVKDLKEANGMLQGEEGLDPDMLQYAKDEKRRLEEQKVKLSAELYQLIIPKDPNDEKSTIVEIRAGTGGEESALFGAELFRMYTRYTEGRGWRVELMDSNPTGLGGFKEIIFSVEGKGAYSRLKYESGVHRVQRVPVTESGGRIHTSAATVAVLPEAEDVEVEIKPEDIRVDVFRSSGPGGQSVNTTDSAVRITHIPTGMVVQCQDEKSQHKNKAKALKVLRARLYDLELQEQQNKIAKDRRQQIGTGDRSERIRTYNYPQNRVTDHRINLTLYKLASILEGDLDEIIDALSISAQQEKITMDNKVSE